MSGIVASYNAEDFLAEAIDSMLAQTVPVQVIVVDDGSTDNTRAVATRFGRRVRVVTLPHGGASAARNAGIMLAETEHVAFLDADDIWTQDKTEMQLSVLDAQPEIDAVFSRVAPYTPHADGAVSDGMIGYSSIAMMIRRKRLRAFGHFDENLRSGEFIEWFARAKDYGMTWAHVEKVHALRRMHDANMMRRGASARNTLPAAIRTILERRRAESA